jgi:hypothetical protein
MFSITFDDTSILHRPGLDFQSEESQGSSPAGGKSKRLNRRFFYAHRHLR